MSDPSRTDDGPGRGTLRRRTAALVDSERFQRGIVAIILLNAVILGVETYRDLPDGLLAALSATNHVLVGLFVVEIVLRIYAHRAGFFRDPWGWFDLTIVLIALVPAGSGTEVLRVLRALRILRLLSTVRSMRMVVGALMISLPGIASIGALLVMVMYIYSVITTVLYNDHEQFRGLGTSATSLFRVLVGDGWGDVVAPVASGPGDWILFISYSVVTAIVVLNLFIAVAVEAMDRFTGHGPAAGSGGSGHSGSSEDPESEDAAALITEIRLLRAQVERLERRLDG